MSALGEPTDVLELRVSGMVLVRRENKNTDKSMKCARKRARIIKIRGTKKLASARHKYANRPQIIVDFIVIGDLLFHAEVYFSE